MTRDDERDADPSPRATRLYGAIDPLDAYPATIADSLADAAVAPPLTGELHGRYQIDDVIGRGGMGEVLSARDLQIGRSVAIKRLRVQNPSPDVLARFLREARIQGRLEHPAVVPVHEVWNDEHGQPFFVMKQLTGVTLADVIARRDMSEQYSRQRLLRAFAEVCLAIEFAHTRGVVHRDLKPANIVLGDFGEVYVLDWGIARVSNQDERRDSFADIDTLVGNIGTETVAGAILGTPGYISPEQIRGDDDLDERADVYALGCILFEILTFEPLHPRGQPALASALTGADARASVRTPERDIAPELDVICMRATAVDRHDRFTTARQLCDAVQRFLDGNRDVVLRRELARAELAAAHHAFAEGAGDRRDAIRGAARALALDPTAQAAALVGRLMLEPPKEMPPEVDRELEELDRDNLRVSARFGLFAAIAYLVFFPILYTIGFREVWYHVVGVSLCVIIIYAEAKIAPHNAFLSGYIAITGNLLVFALFAWLVSPVILGPGPGTVMVMLMAAHRSLIRTPILAALTALAILSPWVLAQFGLAPPVASVDGATIQLHTAAGILESKPTLFALGLYLLTIIGLAAFLGHLQENDRRSVRRAMQLQSWQLRQLVPTS